MADTQTSQKNPLLQAFQEKRVHRASEALIKAQRLVNIYRCLESLPNSYITTYNDILRNTDSETERMLSTILGGAVVRSYMDFLKETSSQEATLSGDMPQEPVEASSQTGWLPPPENDIAIDAENISATSQTPDQEAILQQVMRIITKIHQDENKKQEQQLKNAIADIEKKLEAAPDLSKMETRLQAFRTEQQQMLNTALEKLMSAQNNLLAETLKQAQVQAQKSHETSTHNSPQIPETHVDIEVDPPVRPIYKG